MVRAEVAAGPDPVHVSWVPRVRDVVHPDVPVEPVREEQVPVVHRDQQVGHQPGDGHVPVLVLAGLDVDDLLGRVAARPRTGRCLDLMEVEDVRGERRADEPVGRDRGVEEAHLQRDEPLLPQVDGLLDGLPLPVPDVEPSAVLPRLDVVEVEPGVVGRRGRPLRRHHHVLPGLVPEVVVEFDLARWLPAPVDGEVRLVQFEESARQLPVGVAQHREDDLPVGDAVDGVGGAQVLVEHLPWLDDPLQFGLAPVRRVDDVDARGALPGDDEVAPLQAADVTGGGAGVPPEVVEFVAAVGHLDAVDHAACGVAYPGPSWSWSWSCVASAPCSASLIPGRSAPRGSVPEDTGRRCRRV